MIRFFGKIILSIFIFILCPLFVQANEDNQLIEYHMVTKEELNGEIQIPNKDGGWDTYSNIDTYESLYSVLEDLSISYNDLLEEYNYSQTTIAEQSSEIRNLEEEIDDLEKQLQKKQIEISNLNDSDDWKLLIVPIIILGIPLLIDFIYNKLKKEK